MMARTRRILAIITLGCAASCHWSSSRCDAAADVDLEYTVTASPDPVLLGSTVAISASGLDSGYVQFTYVRDGRTFVVTYEPEAP